MIVRAGGAASMGVASDPVCSPQAGAPPPLPLPSEP